MKSIWGKFLGAIFGYLLAGSIGAIIGVIIGHAFDNGLNLNLYQTYFGYDPLTVNKIQHAFFKATFLVMGHIAKSDGRVSEAEIQSARAIMERMRLTGSLKQQAIELFTLGKQANFNLQQTLSELASACRHNRGLLQAFFDIQLQAAYAGSNVLSPIKKQLLMQISQYLKIHAPNFNWSDHVYGQHYSYSGTNRQQSTAGNTRQSTLDDAYLILGITQAASNAEVKRAYRRMMSQHHPDKLIAKGLPEEMIKLATEKTQKIKAAYDQICLARGI